MKSYYTETVLDVHHWNPGLFSFKCTRNPGLRFENGQFVMMGIEISGKPVVRAYSIASANYEEYLEFFSIKVPDGKLTSHLQKIAVGDQVLVSKKPTGSILLHDLHPGNNLYMLATGTGLAPFLSLIRDPEVYDKFNQVILVHGVRKIEDLAYRRYLQLDLLQHEWLGELAKKQFIYYPTVTREPFVNEGRITELIASGRLFEDLGMPPFNPNQDRVMVCGSSGMLNDISQMLEAREMNISPRIGYPGDYVIERAFVS